MSVLLITHDLGVVVDVCDEVIVMYGGRIMEHATVEQVVRDPKHPYSVGLLNSVPSGKLKGQRLKAIQGTVPSPHDMPPGCPFATRCPHAFDKCVEMPPLQPQADGRRVAYVAPYQGWRYRPVTVGYQLRPGFFGTRYVVNDYGRWDLNRPAANQRWVHYGNDLPCCLRPKLVC